MEVSLLTNLVSSSLLVQATFVPVSYDCSCGQLMKNLSKRENKPKTVNLWGLNGCQVSNRLIRNFNQQISASQLLPTTDKGLHSKAQHIKSSKYLLYVKFSVRKKKSYTRCHSLQIFNDYKIVRRQKSTRWQTRKNCPGNIVSFQCSNVFPHTQICKFVSLKQRKQCIPDSIRDRTGLHFSCFALRLVCWTFKYWQHLFIVYYTRGGIISRCSREKDCLKALTLPVVIFRSAVETMVDTVFPLTSAVKVAYKIN